MTYTYAHGTMGGGKRSFILSPSCPLLWNKVEGFKGQLSGIDDEEVGKGRSTKAGEIESQLVVIASLTFFSSPDVLMHVLANVPLLFVCACLRTRERQTEDGCYSLRN